MKLKKFLAAAIIPTLLIGSASALAACGDGHVHDYGEWKLSLPTLSQAGEAKRTCTGAGDCTAKTVTETLPVFDINTLDDEEDTTTDNGYTFTAAVDVTDDEVYEYNISYTLPESKETVTFPAVMLDESYSYTPKPNTDVLVVVAGFNPESKYTYRATVNGNTLGSVTFGPTNSNPCEEEEAAVVMHVGNASAAFLLTSEEIENPGEHYTEIQLGESVPVDTASESKPKGFKVYIETPGKYTLSSDNIHITDTLQSDIYIGKEFAKFKEFDDHPAEVSLVVEYPNTSMEYTFIGEKMYYIQVFAPGAFTLTAGAGGGQTGHVHDWGEWYVECASVEDTGFMSRQCNNYSMDHPCPDDYMQRIDLPILDYDTRNSSGVTANKYRFTSISTETGVKAAYTVAYMPEADDAQAISYNVYFLKGTGDRIATIPADVPVLCIYEPTTAGTYMASVSDNEVFIKGSLDGAADKNFVFDSNEKVSFWLTKEMTDATNVDITIASHTHNYSDVKVTLPAATNEISGEGKVEMKCACGGKKTAVLPFIDYATRDSSGNTENGYNITGTSGVYDVSYTAHPDSATTYNVSFKMYIVDSTSLTVPSIAVDEDIVLVFTGLTENATYEVSTDNADALLFAIGDEVGSQIKALRYSENNNTLYLKATAAATNVGITVSAHTHSFPSEWTKQYDPKYGGEISRDCSSCGESQSEQLSALDIANNDPAETGFTLVSIKTGADSVEAYRVSFSKVIGGETVTLDDFYVYVLTTVGVNKIDEIKKDAKAYCFLYLGEDNDSKLLDVTSSSGDVGLSIGLNFDPNLSGFFYASNNNVFEMSVIGESDVTDFTLTIAEGAPSL